jgi:leucyl-tRNA---protein transferase
MYLPGETASLECRLFARLTGDDYQQLLRRGWRRFGRCCFRPACPDCSQCRSLRIVLGQFSPSRSQRRSLQRNAQIRVVVQRPSVTAEHLRLYNSYHEDMSRRRGWPRQSITETAFRASFVEGDWSFAREFLYYDGDRLVGVGLADVVSDALSSVYFFHDPAWRARAPGVFSVMRQARYAQEQGLLYQYLGYWVAACPSMSYKSNYGPHEILAGLPADSEEPSWVAVNKKCMIEP